MNNDKPFIEYLFIGIQTSIWILFLVFGILSADIIQVTKNLNDKFIFLIAPFTPLIYIIGMIFDQVSFILLNRFRKKISKKYNNEKYKDEWLALKNTYLHNAYEMRVQRIRVVGSSIFNWTLIGLSILIYIIGLHNNKLLSIGIIILFISIILSLITFFSWKNLYERAYKFRKSACLEIEKENNYSKNKK